jgi:hypothetical protein
MCISTLATIRRETNSWKQTAIAAGYLFAMAYLASMLTYQIVSRLAGLDPMSGSMFLQYAVIALAVLVSAGVVAKKQFRRRAAPACGSGLAPDSPDACPAVAGPWPPHCAAGRQRRRVLLRWLRQLRTGRALICP